MHFLTSPQRNDNCDVRAAIIVSCSVTTSYSIACANYY